MDDDMGSLVYDFLDVTKVCFLNEIITVKRTSSGTPITGGVFRLFVTDFGTGNASGAALIVSMHQSYIVRMSFPSIFYTSFHTFS